MTGCHRGSSREDGEKGKNAAIDLSKWISALSNITEVATHESKTEKSNRPCFGAIDARQPRNRESDCCCAAGETKDS